MKERAGSPTRSKLHHAAPSRSSTALWMLEEIGEPYELHVLDLKKRRAASPAYLAVNPMGKVPALEHDGALVTEVGAICMYLADAYPKAGWLRPSAIPAGALCPLDVLPGQLPGAGADRQGVRTRAGPRRDDALRRPRYDRRDRRRRTSAGGGPWFLGDASRPSTSIWARRSDGPLQFGMLPPRPEFTELYGTTGRAAGIQACGGEGCGAGAGKQGDWVRAASVAAAVAHGEARWLSAMGFCWRTHDCLAALRQRAGEGPCCRCPISQCATRGLRSVSGICGGMLPASDPACRALSDGCVICRQPVQRLRISMLCSGHRLPAQGLVVRAPGCRTVPQPKLGLTPDRYRR